MTAQRPTLGTGHDTDLGLIDVEHWRAAVLGARESGFTFFDWLGCVDDIGRSDTFRLVVMLRRPNTAELCKISTSVTRERARLDSIADVFAGAGWHEREAAELFGVEFKGGSRRRLLLSPEYHGAPLRKDEVLGARAATPWPGITEPGESTGNPSDSTSGSTPGRPESASAPVRRRVVPPGVPDPAIWGDRDADAEPPAAGEVAESTTGGRVRRRRP